MDIAGLPSVLFLLLPGFVTINVAFLVGTFRRLSAFHGTAWSLLVSFILVGITYPLYVRLSGPSDSGAPWPGLSEVLKDPSQVPIPVWILLYVAAFLLGVVVGIAERAGIIRGSLLRLGIDLEKRGEIWGSLLQDAEYVRVYLKSGDTLSGWPEYYSADRTQPGPELYLTHARLWSGEDEAWLDVERTSGILLHGDEISRIEFLTSADENAEEATA